MNCTSCERPIDFTDIAFGKPDEFGECSECSNDYGWETAEEREEWLKFEREKRTLAGEKTPPRLNIKTALAQLPDALILQWHTVLKQFLPGLTIKENLLAYKYPGDLPNLTVDQTAEWKVERDIMEMHSLIYAGEFHRFSWVTTQPDGVYLFSNRYVACPDNTVLLFD